MTYESSKVVDGMGTARQAGNIQGIVLLLASIMPIMAIVSLVPVLPMLGREFSGVEGAQFLVPMALTIPALCVALFSPLAGWLSDHIGRKWLLFTALLIYAGVGIIPYFLKDLLQIIMARVGLGVAEAVIMTIATAMIADYFKGAQRERWIAGQIAITSVAAIVLIALGGALGEAFGSRGPFLLYLLGIPIALLVAVLLFEPAEKEVSDASDAKLPVARVLPLLAITFVVGILFYTTIVKLGEILGLNGEVSSGTIGLIGAAANTGVMVGAITTDRLMKIASGPLLLMAGLIVVALGYAGLSLSNSLAMSTIFAVLTSIGSGMLLPTLLNWILQILPEPVRGRGTGLWTGVFFLGQFIAPLLASAVEEPVHGLANVLLVWSAVAAFGAALAIFGVRGAVPLSKLGSPP